MQDFDDELISLCEMSVRFMVAVTQTGRGGSVGTVFMAGHQGYQNWKGRFMQCRMAVDLADVSSDVGDLWPLSQYEDLIIWISVVEIDFHKIVLCGASWLGTYMFWRGWPLAT